MKTTRAAIALLVLCSPLLPGPAAADCMGVKHDSAAATCAPGSVLDGQTGKCVRINS